MSEDMPPAAAPRPVGLAGPHEAEVESAARDAVAGAGASPDRPPPDLPNPDLPPGAVPRAGQSWAGHARATLWLGLPLAGSQMAQFGLHLTDSLMLGRYGVAELAASTVSGSVFFSVFILLSGFGIGLTPLVAAAAAQDDAVAIRRATRMAMWVSGLVGVMVGPMFLFGERILLFIGQDAEVAALGGRYLLVAGAPNLLFALLWMTLRGHLTGIERAGAILAVTLLLLPLNAAVNWVLIYGNLGAPEMGIMGAAIATLSTNAVAVAALLVIAARTMPGGEALLTRFWRVDPESLGKVVRVGGPIGATIFAESGLFAASAIMMGWLGAVPLAAHGAAIQLAGLTFMIHVGLSQAASVRCGAAFGRGDAEGLRRAGLAAMAVSLVFVVLVAATFLTVPERLIGLFIGRDEPARAAILTLGAMLLAFAALFQLVDAGQAMLLGILRGMQDTRVPMLMAVVGYWLIGIPSGYALGFVAGWGPAGLWSGLVIGLAVVAGMLGWRLFGVSLPEFKQASGQ